MAQRIASCLAETRPLSLRVYRTVKHGDGGIILRDTHGF